MNRPGFTIVQRQDRLTLALYGECAAGGLRFTSHHQSAAGAAVLLGRLFYRQDLLNRLGPATPEGCDEANDAALVMAAYQRLGWDAFALLEGDFALAIYDVRKQCLLGVRDTLGGYPLYYTSDAMAAALSTCIGPLTPLAGGAVVSGDGLSEYLLLRTFGFQQPDTDSSIFEKIGRVRVGQLVRLAPGSGVQRDTYWSWSGSLNAVDIADHDPDAVCDHFAGLLRDAVRERRTERTAVQVSGGMDSSSVALLAAELASYREQVHAISLVYERMSRLGGETAFINAAIEANPTFDRHYLAADDICDFSPFPAPPATDEPWPALYHVASEAAMYDAAAAAGASSMLTGFGGDEVADPLPFDVADRLREWRPLAAWRSAVSWARGKNRNVWSILGPYGVLPLTPAPLRGGLGTFLRHGRACWEDLDDSWIPPWITPDFARRHAMHDRVLASLRAATSFDSSLQASESLNMIASRNGDMIRWYLGSPRGIHTGNPFLDPRVISYGLAARSRIPFQPERQKPLLADAMRGVLPNLIRSRRRKGNFNEAYFIGINRWAEHLDMMTQSAPVDSLGFLDKGVLIRCFREYRTARASHERSMGRMTITLAVLNWLTHYPSWMDRVPMQDKVFEWRTTDFLHDC